MVKNPGCASYFHVSAAPVRSRTARDREAAVQLYKYILPKLQTQRCEIGC